MNTLETSGIQDSWKNWLVSLWFQLENMFLLIVTPQGIEKVTIQLIDTPTKHSRNSVSVMRTLYTQSISERIALKLDWSLLI